MMTPLMIASTLALAELPSSTARVLLGVILVLGALSAVGLALVMRRFGRLEARLVSLDESERIAELHELATRAAADRGDLDQRRLERVLGDVSGGIKRLEASILGVLERQAARPAQAESPRPDPSLRERIVNRLLALGYTDIRVVTGPDELAELSASDADGSVVVEVRQGASVFKGRVLLRAGVITDVDLTPFYPIFP